MTGAANTVDSNTAAPNSLNWVISLLQMTINAATAWRGSRFHACHQAAVRFGQPRRSGAQAVTPSGLVSAGTAFAHICRRSAKPGTNLRPLSWPLISALNALLILGLRSFL